MTQADIVPHRPEAVRTAFGQDAYAGLLPRESWIEAQSLIDQYDRSGSPRERAMLSIQMEKLRGGTTRQAA